MAGTLRVRGLSRFHFDAHHNTVADYQRARHEHELARRPETYLHIDAAHEGIGSNMAWSTAIDSRAWLSGGDFAVSFHTWPPNDGWPSGNDFTGEAASVSPIAAQSHCQ